MAKAKKPTKKQIEEAKKKVEATKKITLKPAEKKKQEEAHLQQAVKVYMSLQERIDSLEKKAKKKKMKLKDLKLTALYIQYEEMQNALLEKHPDLKKHLK